MKRFIISLFIWGAFLNTLYAYDLYEGGIYYNKTSATTVEVTSGENKYTGDIIIPSSTSAGYLVTSIGSAAFDSCASLTSVTIPEGVTGISKDAFFGCTGLVSVTIPSSVTNIDDAAFYSCTGLKKVIVNDIAAWCGIDFYGGDNNPLSYSEHLYSDESTEVKDLIIPDGVSRIGVATFKNCTGLTSVTIPSSVTSIGEAAFARCDIKLIIPDIGAWCGIDFTQSPSDNPLTYLHHLYSNKETEITELIIPNGVTNIGSRAFSGCSDLTSVNIPSSVTSIGNNAFYGCSSLTSVTIPSSVTSICNYAFYGCSGLTSVTSKIICPFSIYAFDDQSNKTLYVPNGTKSKYLSTSGWKDFGTIIEEEQEPDFNINSDGIQYMVSPKNNYACVGKGNYSGHLTLPSSINVNGTDYAVTAIEAGAFANCTGLISVTVPVSVTSIGKGVFTGCTSLAAVIWEPEVALTATMTGTIGNPNLLLYVKDSKYAPSGIKNVVVNDVADNITLSDAKSGNNFYVPREFTARNISYTHNYSMTTGKDECRGWETLSLPFDVTMISHATKGELLPFSTWNKGNGKPFFLYQFGATGFTPASGISANTPYIISMPNNAIYKAEYRVNGQVTFKATDKTVRRSDEVNTATNGNSTFTPIFTERQSGTNIYALNVVNAMGDYNSGSTEGSMFVREPERMVHPFEAVMQTAATGAASFGIFDDYTTAIPDIALQEEMLLDSGYLYNLSGQAVRYVEGMTEREALRGLPKGIYMLRGKKVVIR